MGGSLLNHSLVRGVTIAVVAGLFLAFSGAFGSGSAPLWVRLVYWVPLIIVGGLWSRVCGPLLARFVDTDDRPWLEIILLSLMMSVPVTVMVWLATVLIFWQEALALSQVRFFVLPVLIITVVMSAINVLVAKTLTVETHHIQGQPPARFLQRLPARLKGAQLYAVQAEDHYLRLHTDKGSDLILMRLADALVELEGLEGAQTHRSWWVAKDAVESVSRGDGRASLTLTNGTIAPVSRRHARALREAGWW